MNIQVRKWVSSSIYFTLKMMLSSALSLLGMGCVLVIVARLDVAFFEANGMLKHPLIREAFYYQIFAADASIMLMVALGFGAVASISFIFARSQFGHYEHFERTLNVFSESGFSPESFRLGHLGPSVKAFFAVMSKKMAKDADEPMRADIAAALAAWPDRPTIYWFDQLQFMAVAGLLGAFFSTCSIVIFFKVSDRVVELANSIVHFSNTNGPSFLTEQFEIVNTVMVFIFLVTILSFIYTGYRFATRIATADYALLRDLKAFMQGNSKQRFFLRARDPAHEFIASMNESLDRIEAKLSGQPVEKKAPVQSPKRRKKLFSRNKSRK